MVSLCKLIWVGGSLKDMKKFSSKVRAQFGYALYVVQEGKMPLSAKFLRGFNAKVMEIKLDHIT